MALTMKTFGRLVSAISMFAGKSMDSHDIEWFHDISEEIAVTNLMAPTARPVVDLVPLFNAMIEGKKIDAVREHRSLTGMGLKESKDEVERIMDIIQREKEYRS